MLVGFENKFGKERRGEKETYLVWLLRTSEAPNEGSFDWLSKKKHNYNLMQAS